MTAERDRVQYLIGAHLRALEWLATHGEACVYVRHPDGGEPVAIVHVALDGALRLECRDATYRSGLAHAVAHVERRRAA